MALSVSVGNTLETIKGWRYVFLGVLGMEHDGVNILSSILFPRVMNWRAHYISRNVVHQTFETLLVGANPPTVVYIIKLRIFLLSLCNTTSKFFE